MASPAPTTFSCPKLDDSFVPPEIRIGTTGGRDDIELALGVERVVAFADPGVVWLGKPEVSPNVGIRVLVGGDELGLALNVDEVPFESSTTIVGLTGVIRPEGQPARPLKVRFDPSEDGTFEYPNVRVPDLDGAGAVELRVEWVDRCFAYSAIGGGDYWVVSTATARACPKGSGFLAYVDARQPQANINANPIQLRLTEQVSRFSSGAVAVSAPALASWKRTEPAAKADAGSNARLTIDDRRFLWSDIGASFYRRGDVAALLDGGEYPEPFGGGPARTYEGVPAIRVPDENGRYVVVLLFRWDMPCARGSGRSVFSLDVE